MFIFHAFLQIHHVLPISVPFSFTTASHRLPPFPSTWCAARYYFIILRIRGARCGSIAYSLYMRVDKDADALSFFIFFFLLLRYFSIALIFDID